MEYSIRTHLLIDIDALHKEVFGVSVNLSKIRSLSDTNLRAMKVLLKLMRNDI